MIKGRPPEQLWTLSEEERALLHRRAEEVARRPEQETATEQIEVLVVACAGQTFALRLDTIGGVVEVTSVADVPRAPAAVRGLVAFRGEVLVAFDLAALVAGGRVGIADLRRQVVLTAGGTAVALLVEEVRAATSRSLAAFAREPSQPSWVVGTDPELVTLLSEQDLMARALSLLGGEHL